MRDRLFIRIDQGFPEQVSWLRVSDDAEQRWSMSRGTLSDASREATACQVIVLVPGVDVLLTQVVVPSRQRQHIVNAVPYALEDQLASDIDDIHFALGPRNEAGEVAVVVVAQAHMHDWLGHLRDAGLEPDIMVPDILALPAVDRGWSVLHDGDSVLLRRGQFAGAAIDTSVAAQWFELALAEQGESHPGQIKLFDCQHDSEQRLVLNTGDVSVELVAQDEAPLPFLARHFSAGQIINLIQGDYSPREQVGRLLRPWRLAAALVVLVLVLGIGRTIADFMTLSATSDSLRSQINQVYLDTFPDARKVVDARLQMQRKLDELSVGGAALGQGFLSLLTLMAEPLKKIDSIELRHVAYQDGRLSLALRINNLQLLEQLKQGLLANKGLNVEIQSASSRDDAVEARLQLWRQGS